LRCRGFFFINEQEDVEYLYVSSAEIYSTEKKQLGAEKHFPLVLPLTVNSLLLLWIP